MTMGCNCGKRTTPTGYGQGRPANESVAPADPNRPTSQSTEAQTTSTAGATQSFSLIDGSGHTQRYGSRLERDAARVRQGLR